MGFLRSTPQPKTKMKPITLPIAELKPALAGLAKVIDQRSSLPVLHHVKVERTSEGWIALTGTDLDRFVTMRLEHPAEGPPLAVLIPYDQLLHITKSSGKGEQIHIEPTVIKFALADKNGESRIKHLAIEEFPATPRIKADPIPLPPDIRRCIREAMDCASTDSTRYVLNGTFIDTSNPKANYIVATDGKHLYSANSFALPLKHSLIIPNHKFLGWREFNADGEWQLRADDQHVQVSSRRWRFISKQIEGQYPNWRTPIPNPTDAKTNITIDPAKLETLLRLIQRMPCHDDRFFSTGLEWKGGQFLILGKATNEEPWLRVPVPDVKGAGPEVTVFLNRHLLIKALSFGLNTISLIDDLAPLRFHTQGKQMIVMPVRPDAAQSQPPVNKRAPVNAAPLRSAPPPAAPPPERKPMPTPQPPNPTTPAEGPTTTIEQAIEATHQLRDKFQDGLNQLRDLSMKLKFIHREQRTSSREFNSVRSTLRSIQGLKL
jgi:DNA polymerase III sliding clamp (beta) subunit (PCNA family)